MPRKKATATKQKATPKPYKRKISQAKLDQAKRRYMEYENVSAIARDLDIPRTSLNHYIQNYWEQERDLSKAELFAAFSETKKASFVEMSEASIKIIKRALAQLANRDNPPSVMEAKRATEILESLDKITRLDEGNPTEITGEKPMDLKDIQVIANLNPFAEVEDADYKEIEDKTQ